MRTKTVAVAVALAAGLGWATVRAADAPAPRVVEITARRFAFTPAELHLAAGQPVTLRVTSLDVTHGFFQRELGIDAEVAPGKPAQVTITPARAGRYTVICDHFCGQGHGNMRLTVVVE